MARSTKRYKICRMPEPLQLLERSLTSDQHKWYPLSSKRSGKKSGAVTGAVQLAFSLCDNAQPDSEPQDILQRFASLVGANSANGEDDNLERIESADVDEDDDEGTSELDDSSTPGGSEKKKRRLRLRTLKKKAKEHGYEFSSTGEIAGVLFVEIQKITDLPPEKNGGLKPFESASS